MTAGSWGHGARSPAACRQRLLAAGLITSVGRGKVTFADHAVRRYVEARATAGGFRPNAS